jgi:hypothetical protein
VDSVGPDSSVRIVNDPITVDVTFGDATGTRNVFLNGIARDVVRGYGAPTSDDYEEFELRDVTLQGSADVSGPVVKPIFPAKANANNKLDLVGTATDLQPSNIDAITVNGVPATVTAMSISEPDDNGVCDWNVTGISLKKGTNTVALIFSDDDGNQTKVTRNYVVK